MKALIGAASHGTQWENKFSVNYAWRRTRYNHPETMIPTTKSDREDRRAEWVNFINIDHWLSDSKRFILKIGLAIDKPCVLSGEINFLFYFICSYFPECLRLTTILYILSCVRRNRILDYLSSS